MTDTAHLEWTYTLPSSDPNYAVESGGFVYVGSNDGILYCLNATTGAQVWHYHTGGTATTRPYVVGSLVYVGANDGLLYCLNTGDGSFEWSYTTGGIDSGSVTVSGGFAYIPSSDHYLYCLHADTGDFEWSYDIGGHMSGMPTTYGSYIYISSNTVPNTVKCLNASTGVFVWSYSIYSLGCGTPSGGFLYIGSTNGEVYCLNASTGAYQWKTTSGGSYWSDPLILNGYIYFQSNYDHISCVNASTGVWVWHAQFNGQFCTSSPTSANGVVIGTSNLATNNPNVRFYDPLTGSLLWEYEFGGAAYNPYGLGNFVYVPSDDGKVYCLSFAFTGLKVFYDYTYILDTQAVGSPPAFRYRRGGVTYEVPLVYTDDPNASPLRIYIGGEDKALKYKSKF